jgi:hypothetical protein
MVPIRARLAVRDVATAVNNDVDFIIYVDDSGSRSTGCACYSWIEMRVDQHPMVLGQWTAFRMGLADDPTVRIPVDFELHSSNFVKGRGNPSTLLEWNSRQRFGTRRWPVYEQALSQIGNLPGVQVGVVYRRVALEREHPAAIKDLFSGLLQHLDRRLGASGTVGRVIVDGDGRDPTYLLGLQKPAPAPITRVDCVPAADDHCVQIADLVAYTGFQAVVRQPGSEFMWEWFSRHLPKADGPREL